MKKLVKGIGLFFVYPMVVFGLGLFCGVALMRFFYPGEQALLRKGQTQQLEAQMEQQMEQSAEPESLEVLSEGETLCVDTEYVLEETGKVYSGEMLMQAGILIPPLKGDYWSRLYHVVRL